MKALLAIFALTLTTACTQPEAGNNAVAAFDADHLATSQACFSEHPASLLEPGQTLLERGPDGIVRISSLVEGRSENLEFSIAQMPNADRQALDAAAADFFQAASAVYDVTSDTVIYHRATDGTLCTVTGDRAIGRTLMASVRSLASTE
ncbi:hypothetical protein [Maricaulis salignorans]|uniref:hypothetical protein n=1 Tax=Maricaulis salignorans TaxID=144026 RepID=UPI003A8EDA57